MESECIVLKEGVHIPVTNADGFVERDETGENWLIMDMTSKYPPIYFRNLYKCIAL